MSYYGSYYYEIEVKHEGLNKYRYIRGRDKHVVEQKAEMLKRSWNESWEKKQTALEEKQLFFDKKEEAANKTKEAQELLKNIENTLRYTLNINDAIDWGSLKSTAKFDKPFPKQPSMKTTPPKPNIEDSKYKVSPSWARIISYVDSIVSLKGFKKFHNREQLMKEYEKDLYNWEQEKIQIEKENQRLNNVYATDAQKWESEKQKYYENQKAANEAIDKQKELYFKKDADMIVEYCDMVLSKSQYPDFFPQNFMIDYNSESKILIVEYRLPDISDIPSVKEIKYNNATREFKEYFLSNTALNKMYDDLLYKITLRSIHELYEADVINVIDSIVFNGWIRSFDKATGQVINPCILSIQVTKEEFMAINLANVDPKSCFRSLKGIGSSKLHGLAAIKPILEINKKDKRFTDSYDVIKDIDESENIAIMPWEDFEHLIRQLFEKEFSQAGGEVKVTRASRDGGVDAVAFDPDPIRGGKIVIQAKRYINTVGLSAVRDLYGTVINEGATKGILITTANYGPEAYTFAKGKPLTLLNGNNLLHLLQKHGHKAKIDLEEARKYYSDKPSNR